MTSRETTKSRVEHSQTVGHQEDVKGRDADRFSDEESSGMKKDADIVVLDASVLVHALDQLKKWCKSKREEIIVVPLEG